MKNLIKKIIKFRDDRNWKEFHNSKDLAEAISIEAAELLEIFLWHKPGGHVDRNRVAEELADVMIYCLTMAHENDLDVENIIESKLKMNALKYPSM